jgi:hypothetical protein
MHEKYSQYGWSLKELILIALHPSDQTQELFMKKASSFRASYNSKFKHSRLSLVKSFETLQSWIIDDRNLHDFQIEILNNIGIKYKIK